MAESLEEYADRTGIPFAQSEDDKLLPQKHGSYARDMANVPREVKAHRETGLARRPRHRTHEETLRSVGTVRNQEEGMIFSKRGIAMFSVALVAVGVVLALACIHDRNDKAYAATNSVNFKWEVGISGYAIANPTTSTALTVPSNAIHATFTVTGGPLCVSKGTAVPTPTNAERWPEGFVAMVDNDAPMLRRMKVINCDNSDPATVQIYFRRQWQSGDSQ